jgi:hypothetical protein
LLLFRTHHARIRTRQAAVASPARPLLSTSHLTLPDYSTPLRPIVLLPLIHTRALSTCDFFLRLSDHGNAHCPSATRVHDIIQLKELDSWIALHQLQPALHTTHPPIPHRAWIALRRILGLGHSSQRASLHTSLFGCKSTEHHITFKTRQVELACVGDSS